MQINVFDYYCKKMHCFCELEKENPTRIIWTYAESKLWICWIYFFSSDKNFIKQTFAELT